MAMLHGPLRRSTVGRLLFCALILLSWRDARLRADDSRQDAPKGLAVRLEAEFGRARLWEVGEEHVLFLEGSPRQIGRQVGKAYAGVYRNQLPRLLGLARIVLKIGPERLHQAWKTAEPCLPEWFREQVAGQAEGAGLPDQQIETMNAIPALFHCTSAIATGKATVGGGLLVARSMDYPMNVGTRKVVQDYSVLMVYKPDGMIPHATFSWCGMLGCITGVNAKGVFAAVNSSGSPDLDYTGWPINVLLAQVLSHANDLDEALAILKRGPRSCGFNITLADAKSNDGRIVEITRSTARPFTPGEDNEAWRPYWSLPGCVWRANYFVDPALASVQRRGVYDTRDGSNFLSWVRYDAFGDYLKRRHGSLDTDTMIGLLRAYSVNWHVLHQVVFCAKTREILVANAKNPMEVECPGAQNQPMYRYRLDDLFSGKPQPVSVIPPPPDRRPDGWPRWGWVKTRRMARPAPEPDAELARLIEPFGPPRKRFGWSGRLLRRQNDIQVARVRLPSSKLTRHSELNTVQADYYVPAAAEERQSGGLILFCGPTDSRAEACELALHAARSGLHALVVELPCSAERRPPGWSEEWPRSAKPEEVVSYCQQAVADVCRSRDWLAARGFVYPDRIAVCGIGGGALVAALALGTDGNFPSAALAIGEGGLAPEVMLRAGRSVNPATYASRAANCRTSVFCRTDAKATGTEKKLEGLPGKVRIIRCAPEDRGPSGQLGSWIEELARQVPPAAGE